MNNLLARHGRKKARIFILSSIAFLMLSSSFSCRLYNLEKKLNAEDAEFLSIVQYIITGEERKIFLELPESERGKFKEEFWKRRDPEPDTEENEFKIEYFNRIEKSNQLFSGEGKSGYLTDRGRIYIVFGPPQERTTYPMGEGPEGRCSEVWYYGNFPVIFVDNSCSGHYVLYTLNLAHLQEINMALARSQQQPLEDEKRFFDFNWDIKKTVVEENRTEGVIVLEIRYDRIWFKSEEGKLTTTLDIQVDLRDEKNTVLWEVSRTADFSIAEDELKRKKDEKYTLEIPFSVDKSLSQIKEVKGKMNILVKNRTGNEQLMKTMDLN